MRQYISFITMFLGLLLSLPALAQNLRWTSPSGNAAGSMPCGGGDIGMNVWVEKNELFVYIARSGSFDENNTLLKSGRLRMKFDPDPFGGELFLQELHLDDGYVTVTASRGSLKFTVTIEADVSHPVVRFSVKANRSINVSAVYENWRYQDRLLTTRENFGNSWKWAGPKPTIAHRDSVSFLNNGVLFYHHNGARTIFDSTVAQQGLTAVKDSLYNPLAYLASGGYMAGKDFVPGTRTAGTYQQTTFEGWELRSRRAQRSHQLTFYFHTAQTPDIRQWQRSLDSLQQSYKALAAGLSKRSRNWWRQFWQRSYIDIDPGNEQSTAHTAGRNARLFRYMMGCNANSSWPTKFNGGLFTVDPVFTDTARAFGPDFRNWGGGLHTMQNQRLVYFPLLKNGDFDLLQSQLQFYMRILKNAEIRTRTYWGHGGASFTEQMENFGLPNYAEYGQKRPANFDPGVEYNAWLEYQWDTVLEFCLMMLDQQQYTGADISPYIPFIESCLRFFDEHYQYLALQRGRKALDEKGQLVLYPGSAAETYKMAYNATSTVAALQVVTMRLLELPLPVEQRQHWQAFLQRIPPLSYTKFDGHTTIAPARLWERINNTESPQLYPVYPWGIFGVGKPGLDTALNTWRYDTNVIKFRSHVGWKQDNIWAARLGLSAEAWQLTSQKLADGGRRFPAFWGPGFDWVPDHNWGGSAWIGLQEMLLQTDGKRLLLFPAWPKNTDVRFKLHAPYNTIVEAEWKNGQVLNLKVTPEARRADVEILMK